MKPFSYCLPILLLAFVSCQKIEKNENDTIKNQKLTQENDSLLKVVDSLKRPEAFTADTLAKNAASADGKHPITLQWIGWAKPGEAIVKPIGNGWYSITGSQLTDTREYLNIDGKIRRLSEKVLEFDGIVETRVRINNSGEPCIKEGKQIFTAKGNRKYYRMRNMENCEGGNLVDYIDIFPGTSGL